MTTIRNFISGDFDSVVGLEMKSSGSVYGAAVFIRQMQVLAESSFFVSETDGDVTGYTIGSVLMRSPKRAWVLRLAVNEEHRRMGIGRQLLMRLIEELKECGVEEVLLSVSPKNHSALPLYHSLGFSDDSFEEAYFGPGEDRLILIKYL